MTGAEETGSRILRDNELTCRPHKSTNPSRDSLSCKKEKHLHTQILIMAFPLGHVEVDGVSTPFYDHGNSQVPGKA